MILLNGIKVYLSLSHKYWAVTLDGRPTKTMFKDNLFIPTKALAIALAEEWEGQKESINLKSLHLNNFMAKTIRSQNDPIIQDYMKDIKKNFAYSHSQQLLKKEELTAILENDQICFRESEEDAENDYKKGLAKTQKAHTDRIFEILEREFGIKLKIFHSIQIDAQDSSVQKLQPILQNCDPYVLSSLYSISQSSKSTAIALAHKKFIKLIAFILRSELNIHDAVSIARVDENYQSKHFGKKELMTLMKPILKQFLAQQKM